MALWRLYYHIVWATKERMPLITPDIEERLYGYLVGKADYLESIIHALGGVEDHIHLVVSIPPKHSVAEFVRKLKGSSSHHVNSEVLDDSGSFRWQRGYGIFSLGGKQLDKAVAYVRKQKLHHAEGTTISVLEQSMHENDGVASEPFARE